VLHQRYCGMLVCVGGGSHILVKHLQRLVLCQLHETAACICTITITIPLSALERWQLLRCVARGWGAA
jgi:hypothetical protein